MNAERIMMVLREPHISEKATFLAEKRRQFTFKVLTSSTKSEIKQAVEQLFKVKVESVNVLNFAGKLKKFKQLSGKRNDWKKAVVTLFPGQDINFSAVE